MANQENSESNIIRPDNPIPEEKTGDRDFFKKTREDKKIDFLEIGLTNENLEELVSELKESEKNKSDRIEKVNPVMVMDFSDEAIKKMNLGVSDDKNEEKGEIRETNKKMDFLSTLFQSALPLLAVGGGLFGSLNMMFSGGPLQGIANIISKVFTLLGDKLVSKIPLMGKIFGEDGFIKGILKRVFGEDFVKPFLKGSKGAIGKSLLGGVGKSLLKSLPIIGPLISMGSAIKRIKDDDILGGIIDLGAAVAYMFPGVGTGIGLALDLLNANLDLAESGYHGKGIQDIVTDTKKWFSNNKRNLPIIGGFTRIGEALGYFSVGNVKDGLKALAGVGWGMTGLGGVYDWLFGSTDPETDDDGGKVNQVWETIKNITQSIRNILSDKINEILNKAKNWVLENTGPLGKKAIEKMEDFGILPESGYEATQNFGELSDDSPFKRSGLSINENDTGKRDISSIESLEYSGIDLKKYGIEKDREVGGNVSEKENQSEKQMNVMKEVIETLKQLREETIFGNTAISNQNNNSSKQINMFHQSGGVSAQRDGFRNRSNRTMKMRTI